MQRGFFLFSTSLMREFVREAVVMLFCLAVILGLGWLLQPAFNWWLAAVRTLYYHLFHG